MLHRCLIRRAGERTGEAGRTPEAGEARLPTIVHGVTTVARGAPIGAVVAAILGSGSLVLPSEPSGPAAGILARGYAFVVVSLRYLIVGGWAAAVVLAVWFLPPLSAASSGGLSDLVPPGSAAARAESDAARLFGFPLDAAVAVVQRDPHGMAAATRDRAIRQAIAVDRRDGAGIPGLAGAFPLPNAAGLLPGTGERSTTVITFLYFRPGTSFEAQTAGANAYVHSFLNRPADHVVGVTTDYTVFFLDGMRARLAGGVPRVRAARLATAEFTPIIAAAGLIVAASAATLAVARTKLLSAFGPGLALTVLTAMAVSMTLGPALMAIFGGLLFRPVPRWRRRQGVTRREGGGPGDGGPRDSGWRTRAARFAAARPVALLIAVAGTAGLLAAAWGAHAIRIGSPLIGELPASSSAARAGESGRRRGAGRWPTRSPSPCRRPRAPSPRPAWPWRRVSPCWR